MFDKDLFLEVSKNYNVTIENGTGFYINGIKIKPEKILDKIFPAFIYENNIELEDFEPYNSDKDFYKLNESLALFAA